MAVSDFLESIEAGNVGGRTYVVEHIEFLNERSRRKRPEISITTRREIYWEPMLIC